MKILHTADIHIRGLSRHKEYRASFEKMNEVKRYSKVINFIFIINVF